MNPVDPVVPLLRLHPSIRIRYLNLRSDWFFLPSYAIYLFLLLLLLLFSLFFLFFFRRLVGFGFSVAVSSFLSFMCVRKSFLLQRAIFSVSLSLSLFLSLSFPHSFSHRGKHLHPPEGWFLLICSIMRNIQYCIGRQDSAERRWQTRKVGW